MKQETHTPRCKSEKVRKRGTGRTRYTAFNERGTKNEARRTDVLVSFSDKNTLPKAA